MCTARLHLPGSLAPAQFQCQSHRGLFYKLQPRLRQRPASCARLQPSPVWVPQSGTRTARARASQLTEEAAPAGDVEDKSDEYTDVMQERMGGSLTYRHEDGMNYAQVLDDLIVGSCPQTPEDVDRLAEEEGVGTIFCLQMDSDLAYFDLDLAPLQQRCAERGDIKHVRVPIRDFDPFSLRQRLPTAVATLAAELASGRGKAYVHCTAGLGRAPGTALAFMYWHRDMSLEEAHSRLTSVRPCNPKISAIRAATCDLLFGGDVQTATIAVYRKGTHQHVQVAGLDVGWGQQLDLALERSGPRTQRFVLHRELPPGLYNYKFIFDGRWSYSADHPIVKDGDNYNNILEVVGDPATLPARRRLMADGGVPTPAERQQLLAALAALPEQPQPYS